MLHHMTSTVPQDAGDPASDEERIWEEGWEGHEVAQLVRMARLALPQKLAWLEQAQQLVKQLTAARDQAQAGASVSERATIQRSPTSS